MRVIVRITKDFAKQAKPFLKKYPSFSHDLSLLEKELEKNPHLGTSLGNNTYKIRLQIKSKGRGKSGGARVISLLETIIIGNIVPTGEEITVNLISIYDKADTATITDKELTKLIDAFYSEK